MEEIWKDIEEFDGLYQVSNYGRVKSVVVDGNAFRSEERILKTHEDKKGYLRVKFYYKSKAYTRKVHRLVAQAFIPNHKNLPQVNHKDEVKTNNFVDNLEWCDNKYNCNYGTKGHRAGLSNKNQKSTSVPVFCVEKNKTYKSVSEAERETGALNIHYCCIGKRNTSGGYHWEYATDIRRINNRFAEHISDN